jgi:cytochrome c-type biogenesis protein CcmH/NrfG
MRIPAGLAAGVFHSARREIELDKWLTAAPDQLEAHMQLGQIYLQQRRGDAAVQAYEAALKVESGFAEAKLLLQTALELRDGAMRI